MVRSLISTACALAILFGVAAYETSYIKNTFSTFSVYLKQTEEKLEKEQATPADATALLNFWLNKKRKLHIFIPHNEIKEIDLWLSECVAFTEESNFPEAKSKIVVLLELCEQIPNTFLLKIENVF